MASPRPRILVVDDEPDLRAVITRRLAVQGYDVIAAATGFEGLNKARNEGPDLILLDLLLPGIDGNQVCAMLKRDLRYRSIPIIILSARAQLSDIETSMTCGADAYIAKPFDHATLIAQIVTLLDGKAPASGPSPETPSANRPLASGLRK